MKDDISVYELGKSEDEHEHKYIPAHYIDPENPTTVIESDRCICGDAKNVRTRPATKEELEIHNRQGFKKWT